MNPRHARDIAASVRQRLLNEARASDRPFQEQLQYFAMERFLYRLSKSPHADKFVLKGALMLVTWGTDPRRPNYDVWVLSRHFDFEGRVLSAAIRETFSRRGLSMVGRPVALSEEFSSDAAKRMQWQGFLRKNRLQAVPGDLAAVVVAIADLLGPVAAMLYEGTEFKGRWKAPGPWALQ